MALLKLLIAAAAIAPTLAASAYPPLLHSRQIACSDQGQKECGSGCIDSDWTCCPDGAGGCSSDNVCTEGDNGEYGCCPKGENCSGDGGAVTSRVVPTTILTSVTVVSTDTELTSLPTVASTEETATTAATAETTEATTGTSTAQVSIWTSWTSVETAATTVAVTSIPIAPFPSRIPNGTATETAGASPSVPVVTGAAAALTNGAAAGGLIAALAAFLL